MNKNREAAAKVSAYIESLPGWSKEICSVLRQTIQAASPELSEAWKWGPHYSYHGMVCGFGAFQKHVKVTFFNGAAMKDSKGLFNHCVDNEFSRNIKLVEGQPVDAATLTHYVQEAMAVNKAGFKREIKDKSVAVPPALSEALQHHRAANAFFENLGYGYKKEFAEHVSEAKQEKTKQARIEKIVALCAEGKTLHHKYKK